MRERADEEFYDEYLLMLRITQEDPERKFESRASTDSRAVGCSAKWLELRVPLLGCRGRKSWSDIVVEFVGYTSRCRYLPHLSRLARPSDIVTRESTRLIDKR